MDTHKNARLTPKGREDMVRAVVNGRQGYADAGSLILARANDRSR